MCEAIVAKAVHAAEHMGGLDNSRMMDSGYPTEPTTRHLCLPPREGNKNRGLSTLARSQGYGRLTLDDNLRQYGGITVSLRLALRVLILWVLVAHSW